MKLKTLKRKNIFVTPPPPLWTSPFQCEWCICNYQLIIKKDNICAADFYKRTRARLLCWCARSVKPDPIDWRYVLWSSFQCGYWFFSIIKVFRFYWKTVLLFLTDPLYYRTVSGKVQDVIIFIYIEKCKDAQSEALIAIQKEIHGKVNVNLPNESIV